MENSVIKAIETRRSVRSFSQKAIPEELLDAVLKAGTYAPTGGGRQSPVIVAVKDAAYRDKIARLNAEVMGKEEVMGKDTDPYYGAPVIILVLADGKASTFVEDGSCVLENMMIAAHRRKGKYVCGGRKLRSGKYDDCRPFPRPRLCLGTSGA